MRNGDKTHATILIIGILCLLGALGIFGDVDSDIVLGILWAFAVIGLLKGVTWFPSSRLINSMGKR